MKTEKPQIPAPVDRSYGPLQINGPGEWLVLSDVHLPYHDARTVELAVEVAAKGKLNVLLNGDILDSHELSRFDKDPRAPRYIAERDGALQFLAYLRDRLRKARIVYKAGNHEERLDSYLMSRAPALFGLEEVQLPSILKLKDFGVEWVGDKRVVRLGKLNVLHGHEYKPTVQAPVNPARGLFLRSKTVAMCGHFHQTSEHHEPTLEGKPKGCWSTGCACQLSPAYMPLNKWNHGFATVEVARGGNFSVRNFRVMEGEIV